MRIQLSEFEGPCDMGIFDSDPFRLLRCQEVTNMFQGIDHIVNRREFFA
jgi:hypothetical protein